MHYFYHQYYLSLLRQRREKYIEWHSVWLRVNSRRLQDWDCANNIILVDTSLNNMQTMIEATENEG